MSPVRGNLGYIYVMEFEVKFVRYEQLLVHLVQGWTPTDALVDTHHGEHALLMTRRGG